jgi:phage virion morphogenesis protein
MAGVTHTLDDEAFRAELDRIQRAAESPLGAYHALGAHFVFSTQRNFETETAPDGTPWQRLSPRTANARVGKGRRGTDHILRQTVRLYRSISYQAFDNAVEWGTNVVYGRIHQLGGAVEMPARQATISLKRIRTKGDGIRSRFARSGAKGATERLVNVRGHTIRIPARPYLGISAADRTAVPEVIADYLRGEAGR